MLLIPCPCCGPRDQGEFSYGRDATTAHPQGGRGEDSQWMDYVYWRPNPKGAHEEYWHHSAGCRLWLKVRRDTLGHAVLSVEIA